MSWFLLRVKECQSLIYWQVQVLNLLVISVLNVIDFDYFRSTGGCY